MAEDRCLLAVRRCGMDTHGVRLEKPWAGRQRLPHGNSGAAPVVGSPVFDSHSPGEGHDKVIRHSSASTATQLESVAAFCKDVDLRTRKHCWPQFVLCHDPTGSWKVPTAVDKRELHSTHLLCVKLFCVQPPYKNVRESWNLICQEDKS